MPCYHPIEAWQRGDGQLSIGKETPDAERLALPCGACLGCLQKRAQAWSLRCHLEARQHEKSAFATLTYSDEHLPETLSKRHLQLWAKKVRRAIGPFRFFASGEYGETTARPHYHALMFGVGEEAREAVERAWGRGHVRLTRLTPRRISYTAGYAAKKVGDRAKQKLLRKIDQETGELLYEWQPPFLQMSRRPGIGAAAKAHVQSWRDFAVMNGQKMPVPRYLHEAWTEAANQEEKDRHDFQNYQRRIQNATTRTHTQEELAAAEAIATARQKLKAEKRGL